MPSRAVGIDIGTRTITVAEVRDARGGATVSNFGGVELGPDMVRDGEVLDAIGAAGALQELLASTKITEKRVWLGVANARVVVRQIDLPWMPEAELRSSIRYQVQEHIPIPVEDAELDLHVVADWITDEGDHLQRVLLVAAHRDMLAAHIEVATRAGLKPVGVDLNAFANLRAVGSASLLEAGQEVLVDVGAGVTTILVHAAGAPSFARILSAGGDALTNDLAHALSVEHDEAEKLKREAVLGGDTEVDRILTASVDRYVDEIRSSLDYFRAQPGSERLSGMVLTGGSAGMRGLVERLASNLRLPVTLGNPFQQLRATRTVYDAEQLETVGPTLATAVGLALGGLE
ncbi:MAG TPA: type IV pilus assembly protein PilM [Egicoccus sp.]|nr:type IV pilus assembly protein PilM [Egicoccus sp.]HSK21856.1 type IV pilus assembly protein PilM [Egicoccus sp.]